MGIGTSSSSEKGHMRPMRIAYAVHRDTRLSWGGLPAPGRGLSSVRPDACHLIAGNPVTMGEMTRHVADAGSYAPVTILIEETREGGTRVAYDSVASAIAPYHDVTTSEVAQRLDTEVLGLLRQVTGTTGPGPA